jgi:YHS domain-containing protein
MKQIFFLSLTTLFFVACSNTETKTENTTMSKAATADSTHKFSPQTVDNKKDPVCGMPASAGIEDTIHYKDKAIGFCSDECRDQFLKNAEVTFSSIEWKQNGL